MKKKLLKIIVAVALVFSLCSCSDSSVLKTKEIRDEITQRNVVLESEIKNVEEYNEFFKEFSESFIIPGLFEGFIPQGICYDDGSGMFFISGYYQDGAYPSKIVCVNAENGEFVKYLSLKNYDGSDYCGHAGGVACSETTLFVSNDNECQTIPLDKLISAKNTTSVRFESKFKLNTKGSFASCSDGILWFGDFIESSDKARDSAKRITTLKSGETFYAYCEGYTLENGLPSVSKINSSSDGYIPDYMIVVPEQVQGMAFTKSGKLIFSTSYGRKKDSYLYVFDDVFASEKVSTFEVDGVEIDLLACSSDLLKSKVTLPPMSEGLASFGDEVYLIFESGAEKYRNHFGKYPTDTAFKAIIE